MLNAHNERRKLHCVKPLTWSKELAEKAQAFASDCKLGQHSGSGDGENLADAWKLDSNGQPVLPALSDKEVLEKWYCEIASYDFKNPVFKGGSSSNCGDGTNGHFTQVVWKDTCQLGCARAECPMGQDALGNPIMGTHWGLPVQTAGEYQCSRPLCAKTASASTLAGLQVVEQPQCRCSRLTPKPSSTVIGA